MMSDNIGILVV